MDMTVGELERALFARFPRARAEEWDHVGLSAGDPDAPVTRVACALDATPDAVRRAGAAGASVLLTHHPVCLDMPRTISPGPAAAGAIWEAVRAGVALIGMHTNLDRDEEGSLALPRALGFAEARAGMERGRTPAQGRLGSLADLEVPATAGELAERARTRLGRVAQAYGDATRAVGRVGFYGGSMGSDGCADALAASCDAVVCGECGYHRACDLAAAGCAVIILGHDVSELPLVPVLAAAARACGVQDAFVLTEPQRWS